MSVVDDIAYLAFLNFLLFLSYWLIKQKIAFSSTHSNENHRLAQIPDSGFIRFENMRSVLKSTYSDANGHEIFVAGSSDDLGLIHMDAKATRKMNLTIGTSGLSNNEQLNSTIVENTGHFILKSTDSATITNLMDANAHYTSKRSTLNDQIVEGPSKYIHALPAKGIRNAIIDALNIWLQVPVEQANLIKRIIDLLHESSLLLDDIQDGSVLRRGLPATHTIFGHAQTLNSASYSIIKAIDAALELGAEYARELIGHLKILYVGQSYDLYWTTNLDCPSEEDYLQALDGKTGGLFKLLLGLLEVASKSAGRSEAPDLQRVMTLLGRHFAIRDDYQNLVSDVYTEQKGYCEDLDEGKYTMPIIHALRSLTGESLLLLRNIISQRHVNRRSSADHKRLILQLLQESGSLDYTRQVLQAIQAEIEKEVKEIERITTTHNHDLSSILDGIFV